VTAPKSNFLGAGADSCN